jgi:hypothetical protein
VISKSPYLVKLKVSTLISARNVEDHEPFDSPHTFEAAPFVPRRH